MKWLNRTFYKFVIATALTLTVAGNSIAYPIENLKPIGQSTFKWMFWTIYDASLYNGTGEYNGVEPMLVLRLDYRKNISRERLIETTRDQWQELDIYREEINEDWLGELGQLWPDIRKGDSIILVVGEALDSSFYHNELLLGSVEESDFTKAFLAIWLGDNASFPKSRDELLGIR